MDLFKDGDDYFGFNEDGISRGSHGVNAMYGGEDISLKHNKKYAI